jgi:thiosulfate/3-mercaptopyruvate sulfurtransferase
VTAPLDSLVDGAWLEERLGDPALRVLEATVYLDPPTAPGRPYDDRSGCADWAAAHIPGAAFADLVGELSEPRPRLRFTFPGPARFAAAMEGLGVGDGTSVVIYDRNGMMWATRLWWMLRACGFDAAAVLDGGWEAWVADGRPVSAEPPPPRAPATFTPRPRPGLFVGRDEVLAALGEAPACVLDALAPEVHRGEIDRYGRPGRIPGSANVHAASLLEAGTGRLRPPAELRERFGAAGALDAGRVIAYCGGGIAATLDAFALTRLGVRDVAVYDGSLTEWAGDPELPLEVG